MAAATVRIDLTDEDWAELSSGSAVVLIENDQFAAAVKVRLGIAAPSASVEDGHIVAAQHARTFTGLAAGDKVYARAVVGETSVLVSKT